MTTSNSRRQSGFTLVELLIVVLIIGILATIAIPVFNGQRNKAKNSAAQSSLRNAMTAASSVRVGNDDTFPTTAAAMTSALKSEEGSLDYSAGTTPTGSSQAGVNADPKTIFVGTPSASTLTLRVLSKGDKGYTVTNTNGAWGNITELP